ncbi:MAG: glyoxalase, partial [Clostridiales bacterium]|nr:glyoxalase [Clostridiales bacterium]
STFHRSPNKYVNQIVLKVKNLDASIEFYEKIMGFKTLDKEKRKVR